MGVREGTASALLAGTGWGQHGHGLAATAIEGRLCCPLYVPYTISAALCMFLTLFPRNCAALLQSAYVSCQGGAETC